MASRKTGPLPACRHVEVGAYLQTVHDELVHLSVELSRAYPQASQQVRAAEKAQRAVDELRTALDNVSASELPGDAWAPAIYYPGDNGMRRVDVDRVLRVHQVGNPPCCARVEE